MILKYNQAVRLAKATLSGEAYQVAEMAASVKYIGCVIVDAPESPGAYRRARQVFYADGDKEMMQAIQDLWRAMRCGTLQKQNEC